MDLSTAYRYNQNMMEYYTCKFHQSRLLLISIKFFPISRAPEQFELSKWNPNCIFRCNVYPHSPASIKTQKINKKSSLTISHYLELFFPHFHLLTVMSFDGSWGSKWQFHPHENRNFLLFCCDVKRQKIRGKLVGKSAPFWFSHFPPNSKANQG